MINRIDVTDHDKQQTHSYKTMGEVRDGYHSFDELYEYRMLYNAAFFNELARQRLYNPYKSKLHSDGEEPFGGGWFIVGVDLPTGQITNHYELKDWDYFRLPEMPKGAVWDGHTPEEAAERLKAYLMK